MHNLSDYFIIQKIIKIPMKAAGRVFSWLFFFFRFFLAGKFISLFFFASYVLFGVGGMILLLFVQVHSITHENHTISSDSEDSIRSCKTS